MTWQVYFEIVAHGIGGRYVNTYILRKMRMKKVYIAQDPPDAHFVAGILQEHGISCEIRGEEIEAQYTDCWQCGTSRPEETEN